MRGQIARRAHRLVLIALLACGSVAASSLPAQALQSQPAAAKASSKVKRDAGQRTGREIVSLRTRTSRTFVGARGARLTRVSPVSLHTRDAKGRWQPIDSRLVRKGAGFVNRRGRYSTRLPLRLGTAPVRVRKGARWVDFRLRGASAPAQVRGRVAHYENALPGVDVEYEARPDSVKETLVLAASTARRRYVFDLAMSRGLRPRLLRSNGLDLVDRRGRARLFVAAPFMFDAQGRRSPRVAFDVARVAGRWRLTMTPDARWLDRESRSWPVTVDPVFYADPDRDCSLAAASPETSGCAASALAVGASGGEHASVVKFDLSPIPSNAEVLHSSLETKVKVAPTSGTALRVLAQPLAEPFTGAASWNRPDGTLRWAEPGGEFDEATKGAYNEYFSSGATTGWFAVHNIVREWVKGTRANHGFVLRRDPTTAGGYVEFHSTEAELANSANQAPLLDVEWVQRPGFRRGYKFETQRLSERISLSVNAGTGNLLVSQTDFSMPGGLGPDVAINRTYNSVQAEDGAFGRGWTLSTGQDVRVRYNFAHGVRYYGPGGLRVLYEPKNGSSTTEFVTPPGFDATMTRNASTGEITLTENASQSKQVFHGSGRLLRVEDRNGRRLTPEYDTATNSRIERLETAHTAQSTSGDEVRFTHASPTKLTQMTDPAGRTYAYGYDASNRLTSFTDPQNGTSYRTLYEYNGPGGQLSKITTPRGNVTVIEYFPDGHEDARKVKAVTRVTDTASMTGPTTTFQYFLEPDGSGASRVTDPLGSETTDANDRVTRYRFDDQARVTEVRDALGRKTSTKLTTTSKVESYTSAMNTGTTPNTEFSYSQGTDNLLATTTATGATSAPIQTSNTYGDAASFTNGTTTPGSAFLPTTTTNAQGRVTTIEYKAGTNGNASAVRDQLSVQNQVSMTYAPTSGTGASVDLKPGQLSKITDARGNDTTYTYDAKGNVDKVTPPLPLGVTDIDYDPNLARVTQVKDGKGQYRFLEYDDLDRLTKIVFSADAIKQTSDESVAYTYDRDGNKLTEADKDAAGVLQTTTNTYDKLNRLTNEALPYGGRSNGYTFDAVGNLRSLTDGGGKVEYAYDAINQLRAVYEPGVAQPTRFEHDDDGRRTKTTYPNGVVMEERYDDASRQKETISHAGNVAAPLQHFQYGYANHNEAPGGFCESEVDLPDDTKARQHTLRTKVFDMVAGRETRYCYDQLDRLTRARTAATAGPWATNATHTYYDYTLDGAGNIVKRSAGGSVFVPMSGTTSYGYNAANQLCWKIGSDTNPIATQSCPATPAGATTYSYDANGNQTTSSLAYNLRDQTTTFGTYLGAGQQRRITEPTGVTLQSNVLGLGSRNTMYWTRDDAGRPISERTDTGRRYYLFDALGSVTAVTGAGATLSRTYEYDPYGNDAAITGTGTNYLKFASGYMSSGMGNRYHFGQRFYDPSLGRWAQVDPLDQAGDLREGNRYSYVGGDPVNLVDLQGGAARVGGNGSACTSYTVNSVYEGGQAGRFIYRKCVTGRGETFDGGDPPYLYRRARNCVLGYAFGPLGCAVSTYVGSTTGDK